MKNFHLLFLVFILTGCTKAAPTAQSLPPSDTPPPVEITIAPALTPANLIHPTPTPESRAAVISEKDGAPLVYIPEGEFQMGSDDNRTYDDNRPRHSVFLDAFWIDKFEVTNRQYALCVSDGKCELPSDKKSVTRPEYYGSTEFDDYPVIHSDWYKAKAYCEWAGRRLPTEAEWEKAARGTDERIYPWGNEPPNKDLLNYNSNIGDTTQVGRYEPGKSPYGVYDMAGNVWEWVSDFYGYDYYKSSPYSNPKGPDSAEADMESARVLRGGSWFFEAGSVRSVFRFGVIPVNDLVRSDLRSWALPRYEYYGKYYKPQHGFATVGIRCAMDAAP
ncbi:MAG: hypothetical protein DPW18_06495 [Chloroflexi bacterium]|nr:hypothetical protein [Chloroflexota bacterium]MDL1943964.1 formylglycine-generating enzyme family protein [Chloroflexi bacterium CFX2]